MAAPAVWLHSPCLVQVDSSSREHWVGRFAGPRSTGRGDQRRWVSVVVWGSMVATARARSAMALRARPVVGAKCSKPWGGSGVDEEPDRHAGSGEGCGVGD